MQIVYPPSLKQIDYTYFPNTYIFIFYFLGVWRISSRKEKYCRRTKESTARKERSENVENRLGSGQTVNILN